MAVKVALVHDWLTGMRGGERVLEALCERYPDAPIYTLIRVPGSVSPEIERHPIRTSPLQWMPGARRFYRWYLPLFPAFVSRFDLSGFDLVISSSHCVAGGVRVPGGARHVCYVHAPMRYAWDRYFDYFTAPGALRGPAAIRNVLLNHLRRWDFESAARVDVWIANSRNVAAKVEAFYGRRAVVVHPPVDCGRFAWDPSDGSGGYYLSVGAFVPYKRIDLAVAACRRLGRPLVVVGGGGGGAEVRRAAGGDPRIRFTGWVDDDALARWYRGCRALLFAADEDFGIAPVEAMACGRPVVALGRGGALETVGDGVAPGEEPLRVTGGVLFPEQTVDSMARGIRLLESVPVDRAMIRRRAERFDREVFRRKIDAAIDASPGASGGVP